MRVLLADANAIVRSGLRTFLLAEGIDVVDEVVPGPSAIESTAAASSPDVVLIGLSLAPAVAADAVRHARAACPGSAVVVFAMAVEPGQVLAAIESGAVGYLLYDQVGAEIAAGLRAAAAGHACLAPKAAAVLLDARRNLHVLTPRERDALALLADGLATKQIALHLGISALTVQAHLGRAFRKIGVTGRTQALRWVKERGGPRAPSTEAWPVP